MKGLSIKSIKAHPSLIPLYFFVGIGCSVATWYIIRLATKNPDVAWTRDNNSEPWQAYKDKKYKLYNPGDDYKNIVKPPEF